MHETELLMSQPPYQPYGQQPPQYGYQPQPPPWPPAQQYPAGPPPRRSHTLRNVLIGVAAGLAALIAIGAALSPGSGGNAPGAASSPAQASTPAAAPAAAAPGIGQPARDGDFAFTVRSFTCGASAAAAVAGSGGFGETVPAGSVECIATMVVSNDKAQAQTFFDSAQFAYDVHGRQFSADDQGAIYLAGDQDGKQVNPGVTITAAVPFQLPAGTRIVRLVLHDSDFSGGVTVKVAA